MTLISVVLTPVSSLPSTPRGNEIRADKSIPLRIMPLGDSITWGYAVGQPSGSNGYRQQLLTELVSSGYKVDFIGTQPTGTRPDNDNEGHPGYRISQIQVAAVIALTLPTLAPCPNVVLVHAGTNDFGQANGAFGEPWDQAPARLGNLLDAVFAKCPRTLIIVAKIIQSSSPQIETLGQAYNNQLQGIINKRWVKGFKVFLIDQSVIGVTELGDGVHPLVSLQQLTWIHAYSSIEPPLATLIWVIFGLKESSLLVITGLSPVLLNYVRLTSYSIQI